MIAADIRSIPGSAWKRTVAKLCFAACSLARGGKQRFPDLRFQAELGNENANPDGAQGPFGLPSLPIEADWVVWASENRVVDNPGSGKNGLLPMRKGLHTAAPLRSHLREAGLPNRTARRRVAK